MRNTRLKTMKNAAKRCVYTLVEVLLVISIIAIIILVSLPAFIRISQGSAVKYCAESLGVKLGQTRARAVGSRRHTALLFPRENADQALLFSSFRMCHVDSGNNFVSWIQGEKWENTRKGVVILEVDGDPGYDGTQNAPSLVDNVDMSTSGAGDDVDGVAAVVFKPTGRLAGAELYISVGEGAYSGGLVQKNPENTIDLRLNPSTGRITYEE